LNRNTTLIMEFLDQDTIIKRIFKLFQVLGLFLIRRENQTLQRMIGTQNQLVLKDMIQNTQLRLLLVLNLELELEMI